MTTVLLTGASGSLGLETFRQLWKKRPQYDLVLLLRPSRKNKRLFREYEKKAGTGSIRGKGTVRGQGLKIVWGDALNREDLKEACRGIDACLHTMALIPPGADRDPGMAGKVNAEVTANLVSILEEGDPDRIRLVYVGSVAQYGDRLPPLNVGRTGDPMIPSIFDYYGLTKIRGELAVMESAILHRISLRQTFVMIPDLFDLADPIMYHQPLDTCMENTTVRDSARILVNCLRVEDPDFWRGYYNVSGGPACRTTFREFLNRAYGLMGLDYRKVMERSWFATRNSHQQFFSDAAKLDHYVHHWDGGQSQEDYYRILRKSFSWYLKLAAWLSKNTAPFRWLVQGITRRKLRRMARDPRGPLGWLREGNREMIEAFYGSMEEMKSITGWGNETREKAPSPDTLRLDHGYDENRKALTAGDLRGAALFRGGRLVSASWDGEMDRKLEWECCQGHLFTMSPRAVLKGGHWCLQCISPPWNYRDFAEKNPFMAQVRTR